MNYFFGFNNNTYRTSLTIPNFSNYKFFKKNVKLYCGYIHNSKWNFEKLENVKKDNFFNIESHNISNSNIFFLATDSQVQNNTNLNSLENFNTLTNTYPEFRCNLEVNKNNAGFSSYQSEYSFPMTKAKGSVVSSISNLTQKKQKNFLIFRNIYYKAIYKNFFGYVVNKEKRKIIKKIELYTNTSNIIEIDEEFLDRDHYFCTDEYVGIPIFLSDYDGQLSFEHTHPPQTYINGSNKKIVSNYKNKILSIINYEVSSN